MKIRTLKAILISKPATLPAWFPATRYLPAGSVFECPDDEPVAQNLLAAGEVERIEEPKGAGR